MCRGEEATFLNYETLSPFYLESAFTIYTIRAFYDAWLCTWFHIINGPPCVQVLLKAATATAPLLSNSQQIGISSCETNVFPRDITELCTTHFQVWNPTCESCVLSIYIWHTRDTFNLGIYGVVLHNNRWPLNACVDRISSYCNNLAAYIVVMYSDPSSPPLQVRTTVERNFLPTTFVLLLMRSHTSLFYCMSFPNSK